MNIKKLLKGRIDTIPEDKAVFVNMAHKMGVLDQIEEAGADPILNKDDFESLKIYLAFSPKNPNSKDYAKLLSEGIKEMRSSGELQKILAKYGLNDWKENLKAIEKKLGL